MSSDLRRLLLFSAGACVLSLAYFLFAFFSRPPTQAFENWIFELGEGFGEIAMWLFFFIYARTLLKLFLGKGVLSQRLIPNYQSPVSSKGWPIRQVLAYLDRTHVRFGILALVVSLVHIALVGGVLSNLFFPAVLILLVWQGLFGAFIRLKVSPKHLKRFSLSVHAQLISGVLLGLFAFLGHQLVGD